MSSDAESSESSEPEQSDNWMDLAVERSMALMLSMPDEALSPLAHVLIQNRLIHELLGPAQ